MFINIKGQLVDLSTPLVMGILNVTPDSFFSGSRKQTEAEIVQRVMQLKEEGADIIDVGAYSSRPGADYVSEEEELSRLQAALPVLFRHYPEAVVSVDTFRSSVARCCVEEYGVAMINDISAGELDADMFATVARLQVPYIMMHMRGNPQTMAALTEYENFEEEVLLYFARKKHDLVSLGVKDIILDPGFGFSKDLDQNYRLMGILKEFQLFDLPVLVGISRKKMIRDVIGCSVEESLNGTTVLNVYALLNGAHIIRVHDVREAVQAISLLNKIKNSH